MEAGPIRLIVIRGLNSLSEVDASLISEVASDEAKVVYSLHNLLVVIVPHP
jgi:hypothetical protein